MFNTYNKVAIRAIRTVVPEQEVTLNDEIQYYENNPKKVARITKMTGMDKRRLCPEGVTASDLCAHAAEHLFEDLDCPRESIDALIFISQFPDWLLPATACELQNRLSLSTECAAFDVNQGCAGFVYGLWLAGSMIESGAAKRVLLLVGDAMPYERDKRNRIMAPVFGDGGSATLLEYDENASPMFFTIGTDGSGFETIIRPAGVARIPFLPDSTKNEVCAEDIYDAQNNPWQLLNTFMDGKKTFNFSLNVVPAHIEKALKIANTSVENIDHCILHQANKQIMENIAIKLGFPLEKVPMSAFSNYGNLASASIPSALCDCFGENPIQKEKPQNILLCGYGVGLSWGTCICTFDTLDCAPVINFVADENRLLRDDYIARWKNIIQGENV